MALTPGTEEQKSQNVTRVKLIEIVGDVTISVDGTRPGKMFRAYVVVVNRRTLVFPHTRRLRPQRQR